LVDLDADRRQVGFGEHALDVALDQAGLAHREATQHADLLLQRRAHPYSPIATVNETRRFAARAASPAPGSASSSGPAPRTISISGSTPRFFRSARTASARAMLSDRLEVPPPTASECPVSITFVLTLSDADNDASSFKSTAAASRIPSCPAAGSDTLLSNRMVRAWMASRSLPMTPSLMVR